MRTTSTLLAALCIAATLSTSASEAQAGWTEPGVALYPGARGTREVTIANDGAGGVLLRWIELEGQIYEPTPTLGHVDLNGDPAPGWPNVWRRSVDPPGSDYAPDLVVASDGAGGAIVVTLEYRPSIEDTSGVDVWSYHLRGDGVLDPGWPANGLPVCMIRRAQTDPRIASDGAGGAYVLWADDRDGTGTTSAWALYLSHVTAGGTIAFGWPANGKSLGALPTGYSSSLVETLCQPDGAGGTYVAVFDPVFVPGAHLFRFNSGGAAESGWSDTGLSFGPATLHASTRMAVASEGSVYLAWMDPASPTTPLRPGSLSLLRVTPDGALAPGWPVDGLVLASGPDSLSDPLVVADATGGAYVAWARLSTSGTLSLRALHVGSDGSPLPGWPAAGLDLLGAGAVFAFPNAFSYLYEPPFAAGADGAGGLLAAWDDARAAGTTQVRATRVLPGGTRAPAWPDSGRLVHAASQDGTIRAVQGDGAGGAFVAWRRTFGFPFGELHLSRLQPDGVVPVLVSLVEATAKDGVVRVTWYVAETARAYEVERSVDDGAWGVLQSAFAGPGGLLAIEDRIVAPGAHLRYRLAWTEDGARRAAGEATVEAPLPQDLALSPAGANPATGELAFTCTLEPGAPARLELLDLAGRRLRSVALEPGADPVRRVVLARAGELPGGVLFARLVQNGMVRVRRVVLAR